MHFEPNTSSRIDAGGVSHRTSCPRVFALEGRGNFGAQRLATMVRWLTPPANLRRRLRRVISADTIEIKQPWPRLRVVSVASLLADTIRRLAAPPGDERRRATSED